MLTIAVKIMILKAKLKKALLYILQFIHFGTFLTVCEKTRLRLYIRLLFSESKKRRKKKLKLLNRALFIDNAKYGTEKEE